MFGKIELTNAQPTTVLLEIEMTVSIRIIIAIWKIWARPYSIMMQSDQLGEVKRLRHTSTLKNEARAKKIA